MDEQLRQIVAYLNKVKTRCTYGVVAEMIGTNSQSVGMKLGEKRPEVSWVVNKATGEPTGYKDSEKHPDLYRTDRIIQSVEVLRRNLNP